MTIDYGPDYNQEEFRMPVCCEEILDGIVYCCENFTKVVKKVRDLAQTLFQLISSYEKKIKEN